MRHWVKIIRNNKDKYRIGGVEQYGLVKEREKYTREHKEAMPSKKTPLILTVDFFISCDLFSTLCTISLNDFYCINLRSFKNAIHDCLRHWLSSFNILLLGINVVW